MCLKAYIVRKQKFRKFIQRIILILFLKMPPVQDCFPTAVRGKQCGRPGINRFQWKRKTRQKRKHDGDATDYPSKIAALESKVKEQELQISTLKSATTDNNTVLPPTPKVNPLKPPVGFTQRPPQS